MRTTIGAKPIRLALAALLALSITSAGAEQAVIAGTVFRDPGFALPRAEVTVAPVPSATPSKKQKPRKALTDGRGEFAFSVPAEKGAYIVTASAEGLEPQRKTVELAGGPGERVDVYFTLKPPAGPPK